jgi:hypothetical protein
MQLLKQIDLANKAGVTRAHISFICKYQKEKFNFETVAGMQLIKDDKKVKDFLVQVAKNKAKRNKSKGV